MIYIQSLTLIVAQISFWLTAPSPNISVSWWNCTEKHW